MTSNRDPRIASATVLGGPPDLVGEVIEKVELVSIDGQEVLLPSAIPGVPEYVTVARAEAAADELRPRLLHDLDYRGEIPYQPDAGVVLDYRAQAGTVATVAITGLEAFGNHHLARCYEAGAAAMYVGERPLRQIRDLSIDVRFGEVLPELLETPDPRQAAWWSAFRRIQGLAALIRHGVTDPTSRSGLSGEKSLLQRLIDREYRGAARMMLAAFEHLSPGWLPPARLEQLPQPPADA